MSARDVNELASKVFEASAPAAIELVLQNSSKSNSSYYLQLLQHEYSGHEIDVRFLHPAASAMAQAVRFDDAFLNEGGREESAYRAFHDGELFATEAVMILGGADVVQAIARNSTIVRDRDQIARHHHTKNHMQHIREKMEQDGDAGNEHASIFQDVVGRFLSSYDKRPMHMRLFRRGFGIVMLQAYRLSNVYEETERFRRQMSDLTNDEVDWSVFMTGLANPETEN